jgi:hypothetical protein
MLFSFYGYTIRQTRPGDLKLAGDAFWLGQERGRENFIVFEGANERLPLGLFQVQHVGQGDQVRLHFQALGTRDSGLGTARAILRGITKLVPLIEKALALRGVRAIFFTSHSAGMAAFMENHQGYRYVGDSVDGMIMAKKIGLPASGFGLPGRTPDAESREPAL